MSDIPELDRLIEEHAVFRANMAWDRSERMQRTFLRFFLACLATTIASGLAMTVSSLLAWAVGISTFMVSFAFLRRVVPNPSFRDPFKRYRYE